jgi:hypothetical protein
VLTRQADATAATAKATDTRIDESLGQECASTLILAESGLNLDRSATGPIMSILLRLRPWLNEGSMPLSKGRARHLKHCERPQFTRSLTFASSRPSSLMASTSAVNQSARRMVVGFVGFPRDLAELVACGGRPVGCVAHGRAPYRCVPTPRGESWG